MHFPPPLFAKFASPSISSSHGLHPRQVVALDGPKFHVSLRWLRLAQKAPQSRMGPEDVSDLALSSENMHRVHNLRGHCNRHWPSVWSGSADHPNGWSARFTGWTLDLWPYRSVELRDEADIGRRLSSIIGCLRALPAIGPCNCGRPEERD